MFRADPSLHMPHADPPPGGEDLEELVPPALDYEATTTYYAYMVPPLFLSIFSELYLPFSVVNVQQMVSKVPSSMSIANAIREQNRVGKITGRYFGIKHPAFWANMGLLEILMGAAPMLTVRLLTGYIIGLRTADDQNWPFLTDGDEPLSPKPHTWFEQDWTCGRVMRDGSMCSTVNYAAAAHCRTCRSRQSDTSVSYGTAYWIRPFFTEVSSHFAWVVSSLPATIALQRLLAQPCEEGVEYELSGVVSAVIQYFKTGGFGGCLRHMLLCAPAACAYVISSEFSRATAESLSVGGWLYQKIPQATPKDYHPSEGWTRARAIDSLLHAAAVGINATVEPLLVALVSKPFEVVCTRLMVQGAPFSDTSYNGVVDCAWQLWQDEGVLGFYRGFTASLLKHVLVAVPLAVASDLLVSRFLSADNGPFIRRETKAGRGDE